MQAMGVGMKARGLGYAGVLFCVLMIGMNGVASPLGSRLAATATDPLYTTYCADLPRSEFVLDEGYRYHFGDSTSAPAFRTDTAGEWELAFLVDGELIRNAAAYAVAPVVTESFGDLMSVSYKPAPEIAVDETFFVYNSHAAIRQWTVTNTGEEPRQLSLLPSHRREGRFDDCGGESSVFSEYGSSGDLAERAGLDGLEPGGHLLLHSQPPDNWTMRHGLPHTTVVATLFALDRPARHTLVTRLADHKSFQPTQAHDLGRKPVYRPWGLIKDQEGRRFGPQPGSTKLLLLEQGAGLPEKVLRENARSLGSGQPNLRGSGFYGLEFEQREFGFEPRGDSLRLLLLDSERALEGELVFPVVNSYGEAEPRRDMVLEPVEKRGYEVHPQTAANPREGGFRLTCSTPQFFPEWASEVALYGADFPTAQVFTKLEHYEKPPSQRDVILRSSSGEGRVYFFLARDPGGKLVPSNYFHDLLDPELAAWLRDPAQFEGHEPATGEGAQAIGWEVPLVLQGGESTTLRQIKWVTAREGRAELDRQITAQELLALELEPYRRDAMQRYKRVPTLPVQDPAIQALYRDNWTMMRQVFLPPEGECGYNYYVFSREPQWGWGHGGQVFHESLTMLAYALMDPHGAMDSQRIYAERQYESGYINYRTGPYLNEQIETNGQLTSSAPWYCWINWEVYKLTGDRAFLEEMYSSSRRFYEYYTRNRDSDGDGLCEWGAHAVLESVRDARVAVWDEVAWPTHFEALDLNCMLVNEARSLAAMARELGREAEAADFDDDADRRSAKINELMWDDQTGFYYHVDKEDHDFSYEQPGDLKRREIIGLLPLWAGVASEERAARLVETLTDTAAFWRPHGIPSLAADDPYYNPKGYWNGPVWVEWQYLITRGLQRYGYEEEAREITLRLARNMAEMLARDHTLWEFYSPDDPWGGWHHTYIWAGCINRMLLDVLGEGELTDDVE